MTDNYIKLNKKAFRLLPKPYSIDVIRIWLACFVMYQDITMRINNQLYDFKKGQILINTTLVSKLWGCSWSTANKYIRELERDKILIKQDINNYKSTKINNFLEVDDFFASNFSQKINYQVTKSLTLYTFSQYSEFIVQEVSVRVSGYKANAKKRKSK